MIKFIKTLPIDLECLVIDADTMYSENPELPLELALYLRIMIYDCFRTSLSKIIIVSDLSIESFMDYGVKSMILMTKGILLTDSEDICQAIENAVSLTPSEYVDGFLNLIKVEPQEKVEGRHSIANEWGAEALYNVISGGVKSNIIPVKAESSLYFKYSNVVSLNAENVKNLIEGKVSEYLTKRITIKDNINYLLIDDESDKGWNNVLRSLLPNANQEVWKKPIASYEELSEEIKGKITNGDYDIIFLDLRMYGIGEDNVIKPEDFSGMKILKSIKDVNKGIQVIMLTATNKAWNVKALIDAGANGYYMKESPEYHFPLKYTEQNALAFVNTIKECIGNSYLQHIVFKANHLYHKLPSDSDLSDNILNQVSIALSLILKAKTSAEYAFAYISLEQIFEISSAFLIQQKSSRDFITYHFTEDTHEMCNLYIDGKPNGSLMSAKGKNPIGLWQKVSAIYYQLYEGKDPEFGSKVKKLIHLRNEYIHFSDDNKPIITSNDFIELFDTMTDFLSTFR